MSEELEKGSVHSEQCNAGAMQDKSRDKRLPKQFGDFAEGLVMYVLGKLKGMSVALIDHVGADIIASDKVERRYAISVKGRNIPDTESKGFSFEKRDMEKVEETAKYFGMEPAVALVLVDTLEKSMKIRILIATLDDLISHGNNMSKSDFLHIHPNTGAIYIKYKRDRHLKQMKDCGFIDYTEFELKQEISTFPPR